MNLVPNEFDTKDFTKPLHVLLLVFLVLNMVLYMTIPAVGAAVEYSNGEKGRVRFFNCFFFYIYCFLDVFRYIWALNVRAVMVIATLTAKKIWEKVYAEQSDNGVTAIRLHGKLTDRYMEAGEKVKCINAVFQTWFLFPWVIFFIFSSVSAKSAVAIWDGEDKNIVETLPMIYLLLFHVKQIVFLLIPYMCGRKINHYHRLCIIKIQEM